MGTPYEQNESKTICERRYKRRRTGRDGSREYRRSPIGVRKIRLEGERVQPTGEEPGTGETGVRHYPDCRRQFSEQYQELTERASLRFRHTERANQNCCRAAWAGEHIALRWLYLEQVQNWLVAENK